MASWLRKIPSVVFSSLARCQHGTSHRPRQYGISIFGIFKHSRFEAMLLRAWTWRGKQIMTQCSRLHRKVETSK